MLVYGVGRRFRALLGEFDCVVDKALDFLISCLQFFLTYHTRIEQSLTSEFHGVSLFPLLNFLAGPVIHTGVAFVMTNVAIGLTLDQSGATILAGALDRRLCGFMDGDHILPVD